MSVVGDDQLDRVIYTGKWKTSLDEDALREYFNNVDNKNSPSVDELTPGTVTRTFYDRMPARDMLGVELYPPSAIVSVSTYTFGNDFHGTEPVRLDHARGIRRQGDREFHRQGTR